MSRKFRYTIAYDTGNLQLSEQFVSCYRPDTKNKTLVVNKFYAGRLTEEDTVWFNLLEQVVEKETAPEINATVRLYDGFANLMETWHLSGMVAEKVNFTNFYAQEEFEMEIIWSYREIEYTFHPIAKNTTNHLIV